MFQEPIQGQSKTITTRQPRMLKITAFVLLIWGALFIVNGGTLFGLTLIVVGLLCGGLFLIKKERIQKEQKEIDEEQMLIDLPLKWADSRYVLKTKEELRDLHSGYPYSMITRVYSTRTTIIISLFVFGLSSVGIIVGICLLVAGEKDSGKSLLSIFGILSTLSIASLSTIDKAFKTIKAKESIAKGLQLVNSIQTRYAVKVAPISVIELSEKVIEYLYQEDSSNSVDIDVLSENRPQALPAYLSSNSKDEILLLDALGTEYNHR